MRCIVFAVFTVSLLPLLTHATLYHTTAVAALVDATQIDSTVVPDESAIAARAATDPTMSAFINLFASISDGDWVSTPIALMVVCVANSFPTDDTISSPQKIAAALAGTAVGNAFMSLAGDLYATGNVVFVLPRATTAMTVVMKEFKRLGIAAFTNYSTHDGYPAPVLANPRVLWVATDADVPAAILAAPNRVGFVAMSQCGALRKANLIVDVDGLNYIVDTDLAPTAADDYHVDVEGLDTVPSSHVPTYPFVGKVLLNAKHPVSCAREDRGFEDIMHLLSESTAQSTHFRHSNTIALNAEQTIEALVHILHEMEHCPGVAFGHGIGSASVSLVMHTWALEYLHASGNTVDYTGSGSDIGVTAVEAHEVPFACSDDVLSPQERLAYPTVHFAPAVAYAVAVVVNVAGTSTITLPECTLVGMLDGSITHWDDATLVAANPEVNLPHTPVRVVSHGFRSGETQVLTRGLANIAKDCVGVRAVVETSNWALKADYRASSTSDALKAVKETLWSIGYAHAHAAHDFHATQAALLKMGERVTTDTAFLKAAMASASIDEATNYLTFRHAAGSYPFVGTSYYLYHSAYAGNCTDVRMGLGFLRWTLEDAFASTIPNTVEYGSVIKPIAEKMVAQLNEVTCAGEYVFPHAHLEAFPVWIAAPIAAAVCLLAAYIVFTVRRFASGSRNNGAAPKEGPVTIVFADIQDGVKLWSNCPASMSVAVEEHHRVIRAAIAKYDAYEVKTIDDCFMMAVKRVDDAVDMAMEIQEKLQNTMVPDAILDVYASDEAFVETNDDPEALAAIEPTWNGLRLKIGIHTGFPEIRLDEVTKGYDYYGNDTNIAARVMSVTRGGQILCTAATAESVAQRYKLFDVGAVELKGVTGMTQLTSLAIPSIPGRVFAPLLRQDAESGGESSVSGISSNSYEDWTEQIPNFPFVRDGTMSSQAVEGEVYQIADNIENLLSTIRGKNREATMKLVRRSWRINHNDEDNLLVSLALKILPLHVAKSKGRRENRRSTLGGFLGADSMNRSMDRSMNRSHNKASRSPPLPPLTPTT